LTVQFLDTGHFALETHVEEIASAMRQFSRRRPMSGTAQEEAYIGLHLKNLAAGQGAADSTTADPDGASKAAQLSHSRAAKMEAGDSSSRLDLLVKSLLALGASAQELGETIASPTAASASR
jgi:hypothetical protein